MEPMNKDIVIRGQQIYLRPITVEDTEMVVRWRNMPVVVKNFIYRKPVSCEDHENWLKNKVFKGLVHQFIVCRNEDQLPMGSVYLQNFEEEHRKAESGIYLGEAQAYGKGIGTEAIHLMAGYAFETLGMHKLAARVLAYNTASRRLHEKTGYVQEAYLKDELFLDGQYEDLVMFGAINPRG